MITCPALITTSFSVETVAHEVIDGIDLTGTRAIVTGGASGIGFATAAALVEAGAEVTLAVRDIAAGERAAAMMMASGRRGRAIVSSLDLADRQSVDCLTREWTGPLNLLVNNAGIVTSGLERTVEGWELQFATNHLGHFGLAVGLRRALAQGAVTRGGARIVSVSSTAHMRAGIDFDDLFFERRRFDPQVAYAQSKTAMSLFSVEASRRWSDDGLVANTVNPGGVRTRLQRNFSQEQRESLDAAEIAGVFTYKSVEQGAAAALIAALAPEFARSGGHYIDDGREAYTVPDSADLADHPHGVKQWALDPVAASRLWDVSRRLMFG